MNVGIPCAIVRGGTSKAVFLRENNLPEAGAERDQLIKAIMGTPDPRQIDGLGGADILTSKVAILGPPSKEGTDVDYTFGQVGIGEDVVSFDGSCGNISVAVGPMAIALGFVAAEGNGKRVVRIHDCNSGGVIAAEVPIQNGKPCSKGTFQIAGVPGTGARTLVDMSGTVGSQTGTLLPFGEPICSLAVPGFKTMDASLVDLANPVLMIRADEFEMTATELPAQLEALPEQIELFEIIRSVAAQRLGLVKDYRQGFSESPYLPFFCILGPAQDYVKLTGETVSASDYDIAARLIGFKKTHKAFPGTGAACLAIASRIANTIPNQLLSEANLNRPSIRIGHPSGVLEIDVEVDKDGHPRKAAYASTWRKIMDGTVYV